MISSLAAIARACRWHDSENPGALTSGTQIWTWRRQAARMRWRYFATRREGGTELRLARAIDALFFVTCHNELRQRSREFFQRCRPPGCRLDFAIDAPVTNYVSPDARFCGVSRALRQIRHGLRLSTGKGNFQGGSGEPIHFVLRPRLPRRRRLSNRVHAGFHNWSRRTRVLRRMTRLRMAATRHRADGRWRNRRRRGEVRRPVPERPGRGPIERPSAVEGITHRPARPFAPKPEQRKMETRMTERYPEDLAVGQTFGSGRLRVDADQIEVFAAEFDPQPFHLDEKAANDTFFRGLAASGWHTCLDHAAPCRGRSETCGRGRRRRGRNRLTAAGAPRRRAQPRKRSARSASVEIAHGAGTGQAAHDDAEPASRTCPDSGGEACRPPPSPERIASGRNPKSPHPALRATFSREREKGAAPPAR
jgi:hypothetical protein